jgi:hypothetical protein
MKLSIKTTMKSQATNFYFSAYPLKVPKAETEKVLPYLYKTSGKKILRG